VRGRLSALALAATLAGCASGGPDAGTSPPLAGTAWVAEDIDGSAVLGGVSSTLVFDAAQRISGRAACNQYFGTVERGEGGSLRLKPAGTTRMACPDAVMAQERRFLDTLGAITAYRTEGGALLLLDASARVRMRLQPLPPR